jgi:hypothetical protein
MQGYHHLRYIIKVVNMDIMTEVIDVEYEEIKE